MADAEYPEPTPSDPRFRRSYCTCAGQLLPTDAIALAIVGTRRCSIYGSEQARRFGELLAPAGFTVVSGLARGIDAIAHHGRWTSAGGRLPGWVAASRHLSAGEPAAGGEVGSSAARGSASCPVLAGGAARELPQPQSQHRGPVAGTLVIEAPRQSGAADHGALVELVQPGGIRHPRPGARPQLRRQQRPDPRHVGQARDGGRDILHEP